VREEGKREHIRAALDRGGYETTLGMWSKLAPEAGEMLAAEAVKMVKEASDA